MNLFGKKVSVISDTELEILYGLAEEIVFRKEENGFTIMDISTDDGELITVVGTLPDISAGEELKIYGKWDTHPKFGRQFRAEVVERSMPSTVAQMHKYLASGSVKGIGPSTAAKIIDAFGEDTFDILSDHPERLAQIKGISRQKADAICKEFKEQLSVRELMMTLENLGLSTTEALNAYKVFGDKVVARFYENPYILCNSEVGLGFERVDSIANSLPTAPKSDYRIKAGILHVCRHNLSNGHTCLPRDKMLNPAADLLGTNSDTIDITIDDMTEENLLRVYNINGKEYVFLPYMFDAEYDSSRRIRMMTKFPPAGRKALDKEILNVEKHNGLHYEKLQREAIETAVSKGILILTGGPGTGKTTTVNGILEIFENDDLKVVLTAPTGRAAQRMSEITGREACTIHRLLEAEISSEERMTFSRNARNPIEADAVIVDELSMVDSVLFSALLDALPLGCRLIMVGDTDQLPPVGAGNVLHDLIDSELLPVVELNEVFRQALMSTIVTNAHKVVAGEMPDLDIKDNDFFHMERDDAARVAMDIVDLYKRRLPKAYNYEPQRDIQVLCPYRKGDVGTINLNRLLQEAVNPYEKGKNEIKLQTRTFREGDKVMQIKNDYNIAWTRGKEEGMGIFNGDVGILESIDRGKGIVKVDFEGRLATYPVTGLSNLELAYAMTVHKSQGSEFEAVIMPVINVPYQLTYRNLFYTAVTRAKSKMITIGSREAIEAMVSNDKKIKRYSALKYLLKEEDNGIFSQLR
ncbi:MAG: ATP-dependent RecD-like DNA helicase [Clostridia bacterium]|nr:ATP-dependent RecD-like DNA helicase [Clostridia bacterium]